MAELSKTEDNFKCIKRATERGQSKEQVIDMYKVWVKSYEDDLTKVKCYGPEIGAKYFSDITLKYEMSKDMKIIDIGAGTGAVSKLLKGEYGFKNIDAVDGSEEMLEKAKEAGLYDNYSIAWIGDKNSIPFPDNSYDSAVAVGGFAPSHIPLKGFLEVARVVKPGGLIVSVMRREYTFPGNAFEDYEEFIKMHESCGIWKNLGDIVPPDMKFYLDYDALVTILQVL